MVHKRVFFSFKVEEDEEMMETPPKVVKVDPTSTIIAKLDKFKRISNTMSTNTNEDNQPSTSGSTSEIVTVSTPLIKPNTNTATAISQVKPHNSNQYKISNFIPKKITVSQKNKIDQAFLKLFTADYQPFRIVEDEGFTSFANAMNPSYTLPSRKTISNVLLPAKYEECHADVKNLIKYAESICLTTDGWSSVNNESFMAVTGHFIDSKYDLQSVLLEIQPFPASHTAENQADYLKKVMETWGIKGKIIFAVSDNASNISKALNILNLRSMGCFAHTINLVVKDGLKVNESVVILLDKIRSVITHFKRSPKSLSKLMDYQQKNHSTEKPKKLLLDVSTRWNSTYIMLKRFLVLKESVQATIALIDKELPVLSHTEWKMVEDLTCCLKPFLSITESVSGEKYATASLAIPLVTSLISVCNKLKTENFDANVYEVLDSLSDGVSHRLGGVENKDILALVTFLDPRFKDLCYKSSKVAETTKQRVISMVMARMKNEYSEKTQTDIEPVEEPECGTTTKEDDKFSVLSNLDEMLSKKVKKGTHLSRAIVEVDRYIEEDNLDRKKDPIAYWKEEGNQFPHLKQISKKYLCCLCTSVPCERIFSKAGQIISDRRNRLSANKANMLMFLNQNASALKSTTKRKVGLLSDDSDSD